MSLNLSCNTHFLSHCSQLLFYFYFSFFFAFCFAVAPRDALVWINPPLPRRFLGCRTAAKLLYCAATGDFHYRLRPQLERVCGVVSRGRAEIGNPSLALAKTTHMHTRTHLSINSTHALIHSFSGFFLYALVLLNVKRSMAMNVYYCISGNFARFLHTHTHTHTPTPRFTEICLFLLAVIKFASVDIWYGHVMFKY